MDTDINSVNVHTCIDRAVIIKTLTTYNDSQES